MEDERVRQMGRWHDDLGLHSDVPRLRPLIDGFYSAASDYFTHIVGPGFDYHCDLQVEPNASTVYTTHKVTSSVQAWITSQVTEAYTEGSDLKTFAYVAHEAVHGPMEVPQRYIDGACAALVPNAVGRPPIIRPARSTAEWFALSTNPSRTSATRMRRSV